MMTDIFFAGAVPQNHREERIPGTALGQIHYSEWRFDPIPVICLLWVVSSFFAAFQIISCVPIEESTFPS